MLGVSGLFRFAAPPPVCEDVDGAGDGVGTGREVTPRFCDAFEAAEETSPLKAFNWLCSEDMAARMGWSPVVEQPSRDRKRSEHSWSLVVLHAVFFPTFSVDIVSDHPETLAVGAARLTPEEATGLWLRTPCQCAGYVEMC